MDKEALKKQITEYFHSGYSYDEILCMLLKYHDVNITKRHLNRLLRGYGLFRRGDRSSINETFHLINHLLQGSSSSFGYRTMHQKLRQLGIVVSRETVRSILKVLDKNGVFSRSCHCLKRRLYHSKGPNETWHIDGYDKIKPFGFCIHGAIDGYSRKVLWLRVANTNNDPKVIAAYFLDYVSTQNITAKLIRSDRGTENIYVSGIQRFFRRHQNNNLNEEISFRYGPSTSNQRIESWWSMLRKQCMNWWINFFKDMIDENLLDTSIYIQNQCLKFCFMGVIQDELDETVRLWNSHIIRKNRNSNCPSGRPEILYKLPELSGGHNFGVRVSSRDIATAKGTCKTPSIFGCSDEFLNLAKTLMMHLNIKTIPSNALEAKELYLRLINEIEIL